MAKITNEIIYETNDIYGLLDFLCLNMYEEENQNIMEDNIIPKYIRNVLYILEFETVFEMEGLYIDTYLLNGEEYKIDRYIEAFKDTGNNEMAEYINECRKLFIEIGESDYWFYFEEIEWEELENKIGEIIDDKKFWNNVIKYIEENRGK